MRIPFSYNIRNLVVRKTTTIMTALGIALTVAVLLSVLALVSGLQTSLRSSGDPRRVLVMRKGATAELTSGVTRQAFQDLKFKPGIARDSAGQPLASLEIITVINLPSVDSEAGMNVTTRGLLQPGIEIRGLKLAQGRWFEAGRRELVVGKGIAARYPDARLGGTLKFGKGDWTVVGVVDAGTGPINSEILGDLNQVAGDLNRMEGLSAMWIMAEDEIAAQSLINSINDDVKLTAQAKSEVEYLEAQTSSAAPIQFIGIFVSMIMAVGSSFAAMNTMYAAVSRRAREVGTLRVLGFSKGSILTSFFLESLALSLVGGVLGCLLALPLNGLTTGVGNNVTFSEIAFNFRVGPETMAAGIAFALVMGALGGLFPARSAARKKILTALREI
jgi:putative ABC transport system permease protein